MWQLKLGNCKELIKDLEDNSIDSLVTDPPYELGFMGKKWDNSGIAYDVDLWTECLRVLKPGGHLLAFSGSRTYHRMAVAIEDSGFDIRDQIMWIYGSGFPKSHDVSKAIDKMAGVEREITGTAKMGISAKNSHEVWKRPAHQKETYNITAPATDAAKEWNGWGTALKPAHEPICVARKPLIGTVAENVLQYGTGGINIDGCRIATEKWDAEKMQRCNTKFSSSRISGGAFSGDKYGNPSKTDCGVFDTTQGRWPANLIHDGSEEVLAGFPETQGGGAQSNPEKYRDKKLGKSNSIFGVKGMYRLYSDGTGSAARFFYCAKASKKDRNEGCEELEAKQSGTYAQDEWSKQNMGNTPDAVREPVQNHHPTVKPTDLMRYLCRLVTPPNGIILDPFTGSGSTGKAAILEGFRFLGFDMQSEYIDIASARIKHAEKIKAQTLF